ncbi:MAG TPA: type II toxin-antitoxin system prevent-host-death family antitoxin [Gracilimonas sp.]|uniref:type II toxin-antitoxin system Phd/YefM family antitoxin n=1 Tax=Gracilimonas sp. TaxID=1974203 RepID=UPI002DA5B0C6|nr:type II toxin-antitoxin system prevent-host-death family antitoxin [Gracilimonas sp.]
MKKVPVNKVREQLAKYLTEAERGEEVIITKHNKPIAKLVNYEKPKKAKFPDMTEFRKQFKVKGKPLSQTVIDMRREDRY